MSQPSITIENVSKRYIIGHQTQKGDGLRHVIERNLSKPFKWIKNGFKPEVGSREEFWALRDVSFSVNEGEVVGIIGRNGAGKSTLLKVLSRITEQTEGRIRIRGRMASLLEVGTGFHPELTGRENIYLNGAILGMTRLEIKRKFDEIVAFSEVEKFLDTPVKRYSSGMYVRLAFGVAAHLEPEILVVDEVLAVGDMAFQRKCIGKMDDVAKQGRTVLFVSHNMAMITRLCTRCVMLSQGRVVADSHTQEVVDQYLSLGMESARVSVHDRSDRDGNGKIRITELALVGPTGTPLSHVASGQAVRFRVHYQCAPGQVVRGGHITIACNREDHMYFLLCTNVIKHEPITFEGKGYVDLIVDALPLTAGSYTLDILLHTDETREVFDAVANAFVMEVIDGDFHGTGRLRPNPHWRNIGVLVRHSCEAFAA